MLGYVDVNREKEMNMERHAPECYGDSELVMNEMIEELCKDGRLKVDGSCTLDFDQVLSEALDKYQERYENYRK